MSFVVSRRFLFVRRSKISVKFDVFEVKTGRMLK